MSERESWMPSDEEIAQAFWGIFWSQFDWRGSDVQIRALIRMAVERALAEQERKVRRATLQEAARAVCPDCRNEVALEAFKKNEKTYWGHQSEKGDTPPGYVRIESLLEAFENLSFVRQQLTDAKQQLEETKWECRNLEAENAKLRKCVKAGDHYIDSIYSITSNTGLLHAEWSEKIDYYAARAEVDK